ncbi:MAG: hypothetical protein ABFE08_09090 [Armatimonadia bacterium]
MIKLNLRKGDSTWRHGDRPIWSEDGVELSEDQVAARFSVPDARILFLICGFRVKKAGTAYRAIAYSAPKYTEIVEVWWPGGQWAGSFPFARMRAKKSGDLFAAAIRRVFDRCAHMPYRVDVQAHSLGARVALRAALSVYFDLILLAAPAVDNEALSPGGEFGCVDAGRIAVCWSIHDPVSFGYKLASMDNMLGVTGAEPAADLPPFVTLHDFSHLDDHSGYQVDPKYFELWDRLVNGVQYGVEDGRS